MTPFLLVLLAAAPAPAAPPCVTVAGDRILMGDLARAIPAFKTLDPDQPAAFAPLPGARRVFRPAELSALARDRGVTLDNPVSVCFERATATLSQSRLEAALRHSLGDGIDIEIKDYSRYPVPPGELQFSRSGLNFPPLGSTGTPVLWLGHVTYDGGRHLPVWVRVRLTAARTVLVAAMPIISGHAIEAAQVRSERRAMFPFPEAPSIDPAQAIGKVVCHSLAAGMVISSDILSEPPAVGRGEAVNVRVEDGGAHLHFMATSDTAGRIGDSIVVENPTTHFRFRGVVDAPHEILVRSGGTY